LHSNGHKRELNAKTRSSKTKNQTNETSKRTKQANNNGNNKNNSRKSQLTLKCRRRQWKTHAANNGASNYNKQQVEREVVAETEAEAESEAEANAKTAAKRILPLSMLNPSHTRQATTSHCCGFCFKVPRRIRNLCEHTDNAHV